MAKKVAKKLAKKVSKKATKKAPKKVPSKPISAPAISLAATGDKNVDLSKLKGKYVVLYFYPKDSTPGCTTEGQDFTRLHSQFKSLGAEVFGVSRDSMKSHENFKAKQAYSIDLISDPDEKLCKAFDVIKLKNLYGRKFMGIERSTFVLDKKGKVIQEWRKVKVPGHAEEVLEFLKSV